MSSGSARCFGSRQDKPAPGHALVCEWVALLLYVE